MFRYFLLFHYLNKISSIFLRKIMALKNDNFTISFEIEQQNVELKNSKLGNFKILNRIDNQSYLR